MTLDEWIRVRAQYVVKNFANRYSNKWVVFRKRDGKVMTANHRPFTCCRWIRAWGADRV